MAFEQNQQLQQLLNAGGIQNFQPQTPSFKFQPTPTSGGGFFGGLKNFFAGSPGQLAYSSPYGQNQQQAFQNLLNSGMYNQQNPYEGFDALRQQIMNQYYNEIIPGLAEQFTGGTGGAASSPQFARSLQGSAQGLAGQLLAHKSQYGQQNRQFGLQQAQLGLTPQFEQSYIPGQQGFLQGLLGAVPAIAQTGVRSYLGGF